MFSSSPSDFIVRADISWDFGRHVPGALRPPTILVPLSSPLMYLWPTFRSLSQTKGLLSLLPLSVRAVEGCGVVVEAMPAIRPAISLACHSLVEGFPVGYAPQPVQRPPNPNLPPTSYSQITKIFFGKLNYNPLEEIKKNHKSFWKQRSLIF
jgi:hypothetical protein